MAAHLKKRALAEYSQVIQEEPKPAPKRLKLVHTPKAKKLPLDLQEADTGAAALQVLLQLESSMPLPPDQAQHTVGVLLEQLFTHQDPLVRAKIIQLHAALASYPNANMHGIVDAFSRVLKLDKNATVLAAAVTGVITLVGCYPHHHSFQRELIEPALALLKEQSHVVRRKCLDLIGTAGSADMRLESHPRVTMSDILTSFTSDNDSRVRSSAFEAMVTWHQRGIPVTQAVYERACAALDDDYESVRTAAVKLIWVLCQRYPEHMVAPEKTTNHIRLVDDGFAKICNAVNDYSVNVRVTAMGLLGSLHNVSAEFLQQTLDKKLMSNLRKKVGAHQRQKAHFQSGEWSTGQKWADDAPKEEVDQIEVTLMSSGACGAFIHGLEDEFFEVRNAAIDSLCELACGSASFAHLSQDYLVDMFNDEIEAVRLNAINSLRKIAAHIILREDQLDIIVGVLKDSNTDIRESLRDMFSHATFGTRACMDTAITCLLDNMKRYPADEAMIWECMKHLGTHHPELTLASLPDLLSSHPYFESHEPDVHDAAYVAILTLVFNAAARSATIFPLLPDFAVQHYNFVRDTIPELIPPLDFGADHVLHVSATSGGGGDVRTSTSESLRRVLANLEPIASLSLQASRRLVDIGIRDLERLASVSGGAANPACLHLYLRSQAALGRLLDERETGHISSGPSRIDDVIALTLQLEYRFQGLGVENVADIRQLRLRAHTLQLLTLLQSPGKQNKSCCVQFLQILNQLQQLLKCANLQPDSYTASLLSQMSSLESCEPKVYQSVMLKVISLHKPRLTQLRNEVHQTRAILLQPRPDTDHVTKFTSGLTTSVQVMATLENLEDTSNVHVMVKYPDQQVHYVRPAPSDIRRLSPLKHRLCTEVVLSHTTWSESAPVQLSVVLAMNMERQIICAEGKEKSRALRSVQITDAPVSVLLQPTQGKK